MPVTRPFDLGELNLDTIAFERLVTDARGQIPRFAPDWTDHNLHDPGMTIIDLLGWVVDQQVYQLGFVSDRHLTAFAALLGQRALGPQPAEGLVWSDHAPEIPLLLSAGKTLLPAINPDVGFALARDLLLTNATQVSTSVVCGDSVTYLPMRRSGPATTVAADSAARLDVRFDRPLVADLEGPISIGFELAGVDVAVSPHASSQTPPPWGPLIFDYQVGGQPRVQVPVLLDETAALTQTGTVVLDIPPALDHEGESVLSLRLDEGFFPLDVAIRNVAVNVLPVVQVREEPAITVGEGNGQTDQTVPVDRAGLIDEVLLDVDGQTWESRPDFCDSGPDDPHYVLETVGATFGNGVNGRRPAAGTSIELGPRRRTAGEVGNIRADISWLIDGVVGWSGRNCAGFSGGAGASSIDDLLAAARQTATERANLVTDADLADGARSLLGFGVARAEVISGYDPDVPAGEVKGTRSLVVFPEREADDQAKPVPVPYLQAVDDALEQGRILGERLLVIAPKVVVVDVEVTVTAEPGTPLHDVEAAVHSNVAQRLSVLDHGDGIAPWTLGQSVTVEELKAVAAEAAGVMFVSECGLAPAGEPPDVEPVELACHGLVTTGRINVVAMNPTSGRGGKRI